MSNWMYVELELAKNGQSLLNIPCAVCQNPDLGSL